MAGLERRGHNGACVVNDLKSNAPVVLGLCCSLAVVGTYNAKALGLDTAGNKCAANAQSAFETQVFARRV